MQPLIIPGRATLVETFEFWTSLKIQVAGAGTFYFASTRAELESQVGNPQGIGYTQANTSPPAETDWIGPLWVFTPGAGSVLTLVVLRKGNVT